MVKSLSIVTMGVHAAKSPTQVEGSTTIPGGKPQQEYGANKGVGENPLNGKGMPLL